MLALDLTLLHHPEDPEFYYDIKDPVCDVIIDAEAWALHTGWEQGPSDG